MSKSKRGGIEKNKLLLKIVLSSTRLLHLYIGSTIQYYIIIVLQLQNS